MQGVIRKSQPRKGQEARLRKTEPWAWESMGILGEWVSSDKTVELLWCLLDPLSKGNPHSFSP